LNIDLGIYNERQNCKMVITWEVFVGGGRCIEEMKVKEYG
jgi:hypothetical protein